MRRARGFTLLEVIVAIVIAALTLSALAGVFASGARTASATAELSRANALAQSMLASAGLEKTLSDGVESGTTADGLNWTVRVADEMSDDDAENPVKAGFLLKRITARVTVPNEAQPERARFVELTTLRAVARPVSQ